MWIKITLIIIFIYLIIVTLLYLKINGFMLTSKIKWELKNGKKISREFINKINNKIIKGINAGTVLHDDKEYIHLQFADVLNGENRYLNIYYSIKEEINPYVFETDSKIDGEIAYLIYSHNESYQGFEDELSTKLFSDKLEKAFDTFIKASQINPLNIKENLLLTSIWILDNSIGVKVLLFKKNSENKFDVKRYTHGVANFDLQGGSKIINIKTIQRKPFQLNLKHFLYAIADIITSPIQAILMIIYFIFVIIKGGPVK